MNQEFIKTTDLLTSREMFELSLDLYGVAGAGKERKAVRQRLVLRLQELEATAGNVNPLCFDCYTDTNQFTVYARDMDQAIVEARETVAIERCNEKLEYVKRRRAVYAYETNKKG